ncbi:topoisomerase DNA-binding C4 zinc finger domain-containing protein [Candidatus Woesearchaeota archaeon]|nr:topoisomerase DNA-binding C4 zinc finger domain-containing protein [Candidatus Woesearchaeota archaeon]
MGYTLIITEKPAASKKIADALAEGKAIKENLNGVPYYKITRGKKDIVIACAVGHLYGLSQKDGARKWDFPVFDIEWQPAHETRKTAAFSKKYLQAIKKLSKEAEEFIVATDLDTEGEVIGLNVIKYACRKKDANRMKFSTLTKDDLIEAFENRSPTIEWGLANAGEARHYLDFFNGINYSRALTSAYKTTGGFKILSIGRVQGPALKIIVDREKEIKAFKPVPYWQIELNGNVNKGDIIAWYTRDLYWEGERIGNIIKIKESIYYDNKLKKITKDIEKGYKNEKEAEKEFLNLIESLKNKGLKEEKLKENQNKILLIKKNEDKIWDKKDAEQVMKNVKDRKEGRVDKVEKKQFKQAPPNPFDLTALQIEAYRVFKIQPKDTLAIAQDLYTSGYISYPRTSSNQLPAKIGYSKILSLLANQGRYKELCSQLLRNRGLSPNNGNKTDPAHPAIYPTGIVPQVDERAGKIYDLITRRFMATFGEPAVRETMNINIDVNKEIFVAKGTRTIEKGWFVYYGNYVRLEEEELPTVKENDIVKVKKITMHDKETMPPKRYTPASIIKELEKKGLGTKATRAGIVDTLFQRQYVHGQKSIEATELGINTIKTLEKYVPEIIDEALTRHFENEMEEIREGKKKKEDVLEESEKGIIKVIGDFRKHEKDIGENLKKAHWEAKDAMATLGNCPNCKKGVLMMRKGKYGSFAACSAYPKCKTTFSLPSNAMIKPSKNVCKICGMPMVVAIKKKRPMEFCLNKDCKSKHVEGEAGEEAKAIAKGKIERKCPKCKVGNIVLRKSIYGSFLGCSAYPKCRYTERLDNNSKSNEKASK